MNKNNLVCEYPFIYPFFINSSIVFFNTIVLMLVLNEWHKADP